MGEEATMSSELSAEDALAVARFGGRPGDRGWIRFTSTMLDDHTHTEPIAEVPDPFPAVTVVTLTQGVMSGEMTGSYTGFNVARIHSETGFITGTIIATGTFTCWGRTGRIECLAYAIGSHETVTADAMISIAEGDFEGVIGGMHFEGTPAHELSVVGWLKFPEDV